MSQKTGKSDDVWNWDRWRREAIKQFNQLSTLQKVGVVSGGFVLVGAIFCGYRACFRSSSTNTIVAQPLSQSSSQSSAADGSAPAAQSASSTVLSRGKALKAPSVPLQDSKNMITTPNKVALATRQAFPAPPSPKLQSDPLGGFGRASKASRVVEAAGVPAASVAPMMITQPPRPPGVGPDPNYLLHRGAEV